MVKLLCFCSPLDCVLSCLDYCLLCLDYLCFLWIHQKREIKPEMNLCGECTGIWQFSLFEELCCVAPIIIKIYRTGHIGTESLNPYAHSTFRYFHLSLNDHLKQYWRTQKYSTEYLLNIILNCLFYRGVLNEMWSLFILSSVFLF